MDLPKLPGGWVWRVGGRFAVKTPTGEERYFVHAAKYDHNGHIQDEYVAARDTRAEAIARVAAMVEAVAQPPERESSSEYRAAGLMSPTARRNEIRRIIRELKLPNDRSIDDLPILEQVAKVDAASDILFRFHSNEVAGEAAKKLGCTPDELRKVMDDMLRWSPVEAVVGSENKEKAT